MKSEDRDFYYYYYYFCCMHVTALPVLRKSQPSFANSNYM